MDTEVSIPNVPQISGETEAGHFASFNSNGGIQDSNCSEGTFIKGVKKGTETLTPVDGVVTVPSDIESAQAISVPSTQSATATIDNNHVLQLEIPRGADAVNPFKGWYDAVVTGEPGSRVVTNETQNLPANPVVGDYAYVKTWDIDTSTTPQTETPITKIYECTTAGSWSDSGRTVDATNVQTFASSQEVNDVGIDDTNLSDAVSSDETNSPILPKASDVQLLKQQLRGVTLQESKASFTMAVGYINESGEVTGSTENAHAIVTLISGFNKLRFVGLDVHANASSTLKKYSYAFYDANNSLISGSVKTYDLSTVPDANALSKEYVVDIPANTSKFMCSIANSNRPKFYCYLQNGDNVGDIKKDVVDIHKEVYGYEDYVFNDEITEGFTNLNGRFIDGDNRWNPSGTTSSRFIQITQDSKIRIENTSNINSIYAILNSVTGYDVNSTAADYFQQKTVIASKGYAIVDVPAGKYIYNLTKSSSGVVDFKLYLGEISHIDGLADKVVEVVDNLESNSSVDALSAKQGKELNERLIDVEDKFTHEGIEYTSFNNLPSSDFANVDEHRFIASSTNKWSSSSSYVTKVLRVSQGDIIKVIRGNGNHFMAILDKDTSFAINTEVTYSSVYNSLFTTNSITGNEPGGIGYIKITSENDRYFYYVIDGGSGDIGTQYFLGKTVNIPGIDSDVEQLETSLDELRTDVFGGEKNVEVVGTLNLSSGKTGTSAYFVSGYKWLENASNKSYYYQLSIPEDDDVYVRVYAGSHTCIVTLLASTDGLLSKGIPQYSAAMEGDYSKRVAANSFRDIKLTSDCNYIVFFNRDSSGVGNADNYYMPSKVEYITKEVVESKIQVQNVGITHLQPEDSGQLNAVKRMRKFTDIQWTPAFNISRGSTAGGRSFYNNWFIAGKRYQGIPYARANKAKYGYASDQFKVGFYISLETFMTAVYNRGTVMEIESTYSNSQHQAAFYANICAGSVSAALGMSYVTTNEFDKGDANFSGNFSSVNLPKVGDVYRATLNDTTTVDLIYMGINTAKTQIFFISGEINYATINYGNIVSSGTLEKVSGSGAAEISYNSVSGGVQSGFADLGRIYDNYNLSSLKLGDVLVKVEVHTTMITDVIKDENGNVTYIEVSESTTQGNGNFTLEGFELGGVARRLWWSVEDFVKTWDGYRILRYGNISNVKYIPSPYVPMPDEHYGYARYTMAVLPYMGNNFTFVLVTNNGVTEVPSGCRKLIVEEPDAYNNQVLWRKMVNGEWEDQEPLTIDYTAYDATTHPYVYVPLPASMDVGEYEAWIQIDDNGTVRNSSKCHWIVVESLTKLVDY